MQASRPCRTERKGSGTFFRQTLSLSGLPGLKKVPDPFLPAPADTAELFNLILGRKLTPKEKQDLVAFMRAL